MSDIPDELAARQAALDLLGAALGRRAGLDEAMGSARFGALEPRGRAFARALVLVVLRRLGPIDRALNAKLSRPPPQKVRDILRLGVAQAFLMETPPFAAVATSVDLAAVSKDTRPFKGLVNAVLRGLLREPPELDDPDLLAPEWLYARWRAAWGAEAARATARLISAEPSTDVTPFSLEEAQAVAALLDGEVLAGGSVRTPLRGDVAGWPGFGDGRWWVQDAAAAVPARLLGAAPGVSVLDMCAAPGGKTLQLAAAGAGVTALDRSAARLSRLQENLSRTGLKADLHAADAAAWAGQAFDRVLLDAPCSATGTFRRHPDVLWAVRPQDIVSLAAVQTRLLDAAALRVAPGGLIVYCVCSLEPEEGELQADAFLARHPQMRLEPIHPGEGGAPAAACDGQGRLRILPHQMEGGCDGFFVARFRRAA